MNRQPDRRSSRRTLPELESRPRGCLAFPPVFNPAWIETARGHR